MFTTARFKTKTYFERRKNPEIPGKWTIGMDIGYSSVKVFSPERIAAFPSFIRRVPTGSADLTMGDVKDSFIAYRNEEGEEYLVGEAAAKEAGAADADSSTANLYSRDRYYTPEYLILARVGIAAASIEKAEIILQKSAEDHTSAEENETKDPEHIYLMTGLPPEYMTQDREDVKEALCGRHEFQIKIGSKEWQRFFFVLQKDDISVMLQPLGTLISMATDANGGVLPEAKEYFNSNVLIIDGGFGTLDTFDLRDNHIRENKTWANLGMKRVLEETAEEIKTRYGVVVPVSAMQENLRQGTVIKRDRKTKSVTEIDFTEILRKKSSKICQEAMNTIDNHYSGMSRHKYLIITGGTCAAWSPMIHDYYRNMQTLTVLDANLPGSLDPIFANVRGYYMQMTKFVRQ